MEVLGFLAAAALITAAIGGALEAYDRRRDRLAEQRRAHRPLDALGRLQTRRPGR